MPRYIVSAPVTVTVSWTVDAPDAESDNIDWDRVDVAEDDS